MRGLEDMTIVQRRNTPYGKLYAEFNRQKKHANFEDWLVEEVMQARNVARARSDAFRHCGE